MDNVICAGDGCCEAKEWGCKPLTFWQKAVGFTFNPSGDLDVQAIKQIFANAIDKMNELRGTDRNERARLLSVAITEAQGAQMWAVKGITWKD